MVALLLLLLLFSVHATARVTSICVESPLRYSDRRSIQSSPASGAHHTTTVATRRINASISSSPSDQPAVNAPIVDTVKPCERLRWRPETNRVAKTSRRPTHCPPIPSRFSPQIVTAPDRWRANDVWSVRIQRAESRRLFNKRSKLPLVENICVTQSIVSGNRSRFIVCRRVTSAKN